jgi:hypothetical protein
MTKRPSDRTPPSSPPPKSPKLTREEGPHSLPLGSSKEEIGSHTRHSLSITKTIIAFLCKQVIDEEDASAGGAAFTKDLSASAIYGAIKFAWSLADENIAKALVRETEFVTNLEIAQNDFYEVLNRSCSASATLKDKQALVDHCAYFSCPTN